MVVVVLRDDPGWQPKTAGYVRRMEGSPMAVTVPDEVAQTGARFERRLLYFYVPMSVLWLPMLGMLAARAVSDPDPYHTRMTTSSACLFIGASANTVRIALGVRPGHLGFTVFGMGAMLAGLLAALSAWPFLSTP